MRIAFVLAGAAVAALLTSQAAVAEGRTIPRDFLLYEKEARKDVKHQHWYVSEGKKGDLGEIGDIGCTNAKLSGWVARRDLYYSRQPGGSEKTHASRGEQVFLFADAEQAGTMMTQLNERMKGCKGIKITTPAIGDAAIGGHRAVKATKTNTVPQTQQFVAVRRGANVALYWDLHNDAKALRTMAQHVKDAERMAAKLCDLGGC